ERVSSAARTQIDSTPGKPPSVAGLYRRGDFQVAVRVESTIAWRHRRRLLVAKIGGEQRLGKCLEWAVALGAHDHRHVVLGGEGEADLHAVLHPDIVGLAKLLQGAARAGHHRG